MTFKFFDKLSQNFIELLNDKDDYNVIIKVKNEKHFTAHSNVLKCRSPYFRKELENVISNENNIKTINKQNISVRIFDIILKYIYCGIIKLENAETRFIFDLMMAASEFELEELAKELETFLIGTKSSWLKSHFSQCRSPYFRKELENVISNENNIKTINKQNISVRIFDIILKYIYCGIIKLENAETRFIFDLMMAASEFELEELAKELETFLIGTKSSWLKSHFSQVYYSALIKKNFEVLEKFCNDIIVKSPSLIFNAKDFNFLQEVALVSLLKHDNLYLEESEIWEYTLEWGIAQNPALPTNLEEWTNENFTTLKTSLQQCLPYIRYFQISSADIWNKVRPYKKILDKQLWNDLKQYLAAPDQPVKSKVLPPRTILVQELTYIKEPFSTIITYEHADEISSWIDRKSRNSFFYTNIPYEFELILRGSINGFTPQTFWDTCHGHSNTVIIIKVKGTNEILGGYNPLAWDKTNYYRRWDETKDSFIFSLKNGNVQNSILSRVINHQDSMRGLCRVYLGSRNGPCFSSDLCMYSSRANFTLNNGSYCEKQHFVRPIRTTTNNFSIENYEVFKVINKKAS
ncbi:hypothetical protein Glove_174g40 [Diversispora epigaea]|uniref:BTB domain-containing protein n=1 Tax=Diversispora epigaea TaxID=1348612 RepID=A0A397IP63_9GLOM|nr:hypothetical protein Glove_174g40 [Diversispora epigaea]